MLFQLR